MSWSLELRGGDLTLGGAKLGQTTGLNKLVQDLRCALLEPRGFDNLHPSFGSLIDGGIDENGIQVGTIIGGSQWEFAINRIENEIRRVAAFHQQRQAERSKNDRLQYGESTLSNEELLLNISSVSFSQAQDKLMVNVQLQTGQGQEVTISVPVADSSTLN